MTQTAINYAKAIFELGFEKQALDKSREIFECAPELMEALVDPSIKISSKRAVIDKLFPESVRNFIKLLCDNGSVALFFEICDAYEAIADEAAGELVAELVYTTAPSDSQLDGIKKKLLKDYGKTSIKLTLTEDKDLLGGFIIKVGDEEIGHSVRGHLKGLSQKLIRR